MGGRWSLMERVMGRDMNMLPLEGKEMNKEDWREKRGVKREGHK